MDNLTHTLIGFVAGETVARATRTRGSGLPAGARRNFFVTLAAVGSNIPDADLIVPYAGGSRDKLSYLLEHRGYTHTVIGCVVLAMLLYACAEAWARYKKYPLTWHDRRALIGVSMLGTALHLFMDFLNSYGVHPFWPFDNAWVYGDSVFIVEPLYWFVTIPMYFVVRTAPAKFAVAAIGIGAILAVNFAGDGSPWFTVPFIAVAGALSMLGKHVPARVTTFVCAALMIAVTATFVGAQRVAAANTESIVATAFPNETLVDHVLTPEPLNPLCWSALVLTTEQGQYKVRRAMVSNAPVVLPAERCPRLRAGAGKSTAKMEEVTVDSSAAVAWRGEWSMALDRLRSLNDADCEVRALMQFARAPFATEIKTGWIVGDLRFDNEAGQGFAEVALDPARAHACRFNVPWTPPRQGLLQIPRGVEIERSQPPGD